MHLRAALPTLALALAALALPSTHADATAARAAMTAPAPAPAANSAATAKATARLETAATASGLRPEVLALAMRAYARVVAEGRVVRPVLTVVDYSRPSREQRLWVLDLAHDSVLARELVAHGKNSGDDLATRFSNRDGSNQTSLGTFVTGDTYTGKHGLSLKLHGLDAGLNDHAEARAIVVHGAEYVNAGIVDALGRLGRSQGCPALSPAAAPRIIDLIKGGSVFFAYYPSPALERTLAAS